MSSQFPRDRSSPWALQGLYDQVPAAEEIDILEEVDADEYRAQWQTRFDEIEWPPDDMQDPVPYEGAEQALIRWLKYELNATVIADFKTE